MKTTNLFTTGIVLCFILGFVGFSCMNEEDGANVTILTPGGTNTDDTNTDDTNTDTTLYMKGNLFNDSAGSVLSGYKISYVPPSQSQNQSSRPIRSTRSSSQIVTTNKDGKYGFEISGGEETHTFEVKDAGDDLKGTFSIAVNEDNAFSIEHGLSIAGSGFSTTVPAILSQQPVENGLSQPYSQIPGGTSADKAAILEVVHRRVIERLYKSGWRLAAKNTDGIYKNTISGPQGGSATYLIIGDETGINRHEVPFTDGEPFNGSSDILQDPSDSRIVREKMHIFKFEDYSENGITINGTFGFIFGFINYNSNHATFIYATDATKWGGDPGEHGTISRLQEVIDYVEYRTAPWILNRAHIHNELNGLVASNTLTVSGDYTDTVDVSFDILSQESAIDKKGLSTNDAADAYYWRDELEFNYHFASGGDDVLLTELTGPGIYKRTYYELFVALATVPKNPNAESQLFVVPGPEGGKATFTVNKGKTDFGYNVKETHAFTNYAANDIILNGEYSYIYKIDDSGQFIEGVTFPGTVEISGYFNGTARHQILIWDSGSNFQLTNWYFVDDYMHGWERATVVLPVSWGN
ncbi:MAG: hypothetical protein GY866_35715 [Proteobacteria bacterium]|nr:hypothetical protein [Pseudomonadota bacterium]